MMCCPVAGGRRLIPLWLRSLGAEGRVGRVGRGEGRRFARQRAVMRPDRDHHETASS
jgi:hypothetical protein